VNALTGDKNWSSWNKKSIPKFSIIFASSPVPRTLYFSPKV
jgi:hypothetical protein